MTLQTRRIVLAARPQGAPEASDFRLENAEVGAPGDGEVLLGTLWLSLDPYMRGRMSDGPSYAEPVAIDGVMGAQTVARVEASHHPGFDVGDLVLANSGWQSRQISDGSGLMKLPADMAHPSWALGVMGMTGFTAYVGLLDLGTPKEGETIVVGAATGAVGSIVGQIGKIKGCRVVGVAGGPEKCGHAVEVLGFDACIDHRADDFADQLKAACRDGVDVYFESVGGAVFAAVLPLLNTHARVPVCGLIAQYNATGPAEGPHWLPGLMRQVLTKRIKMQGFIIFDHYADRYADFSRDMAGWLAKGRVQYREDVTEGLENAPEAFIGLLEGRNFGKVVVKVAG
jgi:NADPH-dependent curcumin reductase CurA